MTGAAPALPTGGGALAGIGETFQPDLHTGTGTLSVPIPLPPGRGALTPHLSLSYSSGTGNGPFGLGWTLDLPRIARRTDRRVPTYDDDLDVFVLSGAEELVPVPLGTATPPDLPAGAGATRYRPRTEAGFARIVHVTGARDDYWDVWTPDGLRSRYGTQRPSGADPDWADPAAIRNPIGGGVFSWLLTSTRDTLGNTIAYTYTGDSDPQRYLSTICYADYSDPANPSYAVKVTIQYDPTPRPDPFTDRKPGFALTTARRAAAIGVATVGSGDAPATTVELEYVEKDSSSGSGVSLLRSIQVVGHDGTTAPEQRLPPLTFGYRDWDPTRRQYRNLADRLPPAGLAGGTDLIDLFADGLPSVIELNGTARYWRNRGAGQFDPPRALTAAPAGATLGAPGTLVYDLDGDGRPEIAVGDDGAPFVWRLKDPFTDPPDQAGFAAPSPAGTPLPGLHLTDPRVGLIDLTGTHIPDLVFSGTTSPLTATGDGRGGFAHLRPLPDPPPPATDLTDPRVHLADMTGDGLTDLVMVHDGSVRYWSNLGHGRFDHPVDMATPPRFADPDGDVALGFDPHRLLLGDVTGDGTADVLYVTDGATTIWLNQSGNGFAPPTVIRGTPRAAGTASVRLADIDGTGVAGILWTGVGPSGTWAFLDPAGGTKPYLLTDVDNHHGAATKLTWSTSTAFATADRDAGRPWRTSLPFPVHVLAATETRDFFAHTLLTEQYSYHEGYWDPVDREFRGFSRVEHTDTLTTIQPARPAAATLTTLDPLIPPSRTPAGLDPVLQGNLLRNWSFDVSRDVGSTTLTTTPANPDAPGVSAATEWTTWNDAPATTTTTLEPSTLPQGSGGTMLHVTATAAGCGIVQTFLPTGTGPARVVASAWVYVLRGAVQVGIGNGADTGLDALCDRHDQWTLVQAGNTRTPANEVVIYAADPAGADFYVDHAWVRAADAAPDPTSSPPVRTVTWFHPGPVGPAHGPWTVPDPSADYWPGDPPFQAHVDLSPLPQDLPRPALREALRGMRGMVLRSETYADDSDPAFSGRPYTVHDATHQVAAVLDGRPPTDPSWLGRPVVTVRTVLTRTATWDRGTDPMTHISASALFDDYGRPHVSADAGVPRGRDPRTSGEPCLATTTSVEYATRDDETLYRLNCTSRRTRQEALDPGTSPVLDFLTDALAGRTSGPLRALELTYFDGAAFVGLPNGQLGDHGLPTRTENLTLTPDLLARITEPAVPGGTSGPPLPYLPADGSPPPPAWGSDYPDAFRDAVLSAPASRGPALGYRWHDDTPPGTAGYYTQTSRTCYDVQQPPPGRQPRGLPIATLDASGGQTSTQWDQYQLLVASSTDPAGLTTTAEYDYRVLKPSMVIDPNGNRARAGYTPLGLPAWTAHVGKDGHRDGDTVDQPGQSFTYDLSAWDDSLTRATPDPISVTTVKRVDHRWTLVARADAARAAAGQPAMTDAEITAMFGPTEEDDHPERFIRIIQFSDGLGRSLQTRAQADEVGVSAVGLPDDTTPVAGAVGADPANPAPRVVVSSWNVYDNKGRPVTTYEPFYDTGYGYIEPTAQRLTGLACVRHHYDPRGRPTVTTAPDGSQTRIVHGVPVLLTSPGVMVPTPWETYTYGPSDNAGRTHPTLTLDQVDHWNTPSSVVLDALGRTVRATERGLAADVVTTRTYDIDGRLLSVADPLGRHAAQHIYDLAGREWLSWLLDAGAVRTVHDAADGVVEHRDDRGARGLTAFDTAHRAGRTWAVDRAGQQPTLRHRTVFGDDPGSGLTSVQAAEMNALGRLVTLLDEAGRVSTTGYDLDGNPAATTRQILRPELLLSLLPATDSGSWTDTAYAVDWPGPDQPAAAADALLDPVAYTTDSEFDALGRRSSTTFPTDSTGARARVNLEYARGGGLTFVAVDGVPYLSQALYDARGRRSLQIAGNGVLERYLYDPSTSRLRRHHAQHASGTGPATWAVDGPVLADHTYRYDVAGNLLTIADRTPGCGVPPADPDRLDRQLSYDPLERLARATGRETDLVPAQPWIDVPRSTDPTKARGYTETYLYDAVGNLLELRHMTSPDGAYTRAFALNPDSNQIASMTTGSVTVPYAYDAAGAITREASNRLFEWDCSHRLVTFRDQGGDGSPSLYAQYRYDATGQRVAKLVRRSSGPDELTIYLGGFERTIRGPAGGATATYDRIELTDANTRLARIQRGEPPPGDALGGHPSVYSLADHLGSVTTTVDAHGSMLNREEYLPYGETAFGSYARKRYRFTAAERDEESGLARHAHRFYAPWLARWISTDPAGQIDSLNLYQYAKACPTTRVDPSGLAADIPSPRGPISGHPVLNQVYEATMKRRFKSETAEAALHKFGEMVEDAFIRKGAGSNTARGTAVNVARTHFKAVSKAVRAGAAKVGMSLEHVDLHHINELAKHFRQALNPDNIVPLAHDAEHALVHLKPPRGVVNLKMLGRTLGAAGIILGAAVSIRHVRDAYRESVRTKSADPLAQAVGREGGSWAGAAAGAAFGAEVGLLLGPVGSAVGLIVGAAAGGFLGEKAGAVKFAELAAHGAAALSDGMQQALDTAISGPIRPFYGG